MAEVVADLGLRAAQGVKVEFAAEAEEGAKVVPRAASRVELEAKAGCTVGVGVAAKAEARKAMCGARVESEGHEAAAVKRAAAKTKRKRGVLTTTAAVTVWQEIVC